MKRITRKPAAKTIPESVMREIRRTEGAIVEIAGLAGCRHSYVSNVIAGRRPCSARLWDAISRWISTPRQGLRDMAIVEMAAAQGAELVDAPGRQRKLEMAGVA